MNCEDIIIVLIMLLIVWWWLHGSKNLLINILNNKYYKIRFKIYKILNKIRNMKKR